METWIIVLAILAGIVGTVGSILPGLPGTPVSWVGLLLLYLWGPVDMPLKTLIVWGVVVAVVSVVDYIVPMYFTKLTGGSKYAERGALVLLFCTVKDDQNDTSDDRPDKNGKNKLLPAQKKSCGCGELNIAKSQSFSF